MQTLLGYLILMSRGMAKVDLEAPFFLSKDNRKTNKFPRRAFIGLFSQFECQ